MLNVKKQIAVLATIFKRELTQEMVEYYLDSLKSFDEKIICDALKKCSIELKHFPTIADIHQRIKTERLDEFDIVGKIYEAIDYYGYSSPRKAREHMGEIAWRAVHSCGGWMRVCSTPASDDSSLRAQLRMAAQGAIKRERDFPEEFMQIDGGGKNLLSEILQSVEEYGKNLQKNDA